MIELYDADTGAQLATFDHEDGRPLPVPDVGDPLVVAMHPGEDAPANAPRTVLHLVVTRRVFYLTQLWLEGAMSSGAVAVYARRVPADETR